jgi:hypothetical protein
MVWICAEGSTADTSSVDFQKKELDNRPGLKFRGVDWLWGPGGPGRAGLTSETSQGQLVDALPALAAPAINLPAASQILATKYLQLRIVRRRQLLLQVRCRYGEEFLPSTSNNQCSVHMQAGTYLVGSGAQDGLHSGTRFTGARGGGFGQDFISLCLSLGPRSLIRLFPCGMKWRLANRWVLPGHRLGDSHTHSLLTDSQRASPAPLSAWPLGLALTVRA